MTKLSLDKGKIHILLLEGVHPSAVDCLKGAGYRQITYLKTSLSDAELQTQIADVHMIGIRSRTQITAPILKHASKLIAIGCFCIGTNQVDLKMATEQGIAVFNAPYSNTRSVAELVLCETIALLRGLPAKNAAAHRGEWQKSATQAHEIRGKTLGIVGYGNIGAQLSVLAESLGMRIIYHDIVTKLPLGNARPVDSLDALLTQADVVTLHVPETAETKHMMGAAQFAKMRPESIFINASRGTVVDINALVTALEKQQLLGAALDVFPKEPHSNTEPFESPLQKFDNVILTPHIGGSTLEAQESIGLEVATKLLKYSDNGSTETAVNFPAVSLPEHVGKHRLLHIHENRPGVLSEVNRVFSDNQINISSQYLQTNEKIGYVVMDIDAEHSELALKKLRHVPGTIRTRVLF